MNATTWEKVPNLPLVRTYAHDLAPHIYSEAGLRNAITVLKIKRQGGLINEIDYKKQLAHLKLGLHVIKQCT